MSKDRDSDFSGFRIPQHYFRARLLTYEDIEPFVAREELPDWLIDHLRDGEGYWTASSSTYPTYNYTKAVFGVVNDKQQGKLMELLPVSQDNENFKKMGVRPVITLQK